MKRIKVNLAKKSYQILIGHKILPNLGAVLKRLNIGSGAIVITTPNIWSLYGTKLKRSLASAGLDVSVKKIPDKETSKSSKEALNLIQDISRTDKKKGTFIIAFGGGVTGDLAGFVASIYKRGIPYIQVPTTLLGQVDSAIGGKVAIDLPVAKNLVGSFYQPRLVFSDTSLLKSLPKREIASGMSEVIKYGVIKDARLFTFIEKNLKKLLKLNGGMLEYVITKCAGIKARVVEKDEYDSRGVRAILNFGHTIGHAIESACGYSKLYTHGEAIALGMIAASDIAVSLGLFKKEGRDRIATLIKNTGLPGRIRGVGLNSIMEAQSYDKKILGGVNRFVLPRKIGKVGIYKQIPKNLIKETIKKAYAKK